MIGLLLRCKVVGSEVGFYIPPMLFGSLIIYLAGVGFFIRSALLYFGLWFFESWHLVEMVECIRILLVQVVLLMVNSASRLFS